MTRLHDDETGMVGKIIVIWLLLVALLGVVALDAGSILFAKFRLSDLASNAATAGATAYRNGRDVGEACDAAEAAIKGEEEDQRIADGFCKVNPATGEVVITLRKQAKTILAGRLGFTEDLTKIVIRESGHPPSL
jgi:hypothetical protein